LASFTALLTLPLLYQIGKLSQDALTGVLLLLLGAISPFVLYYAQETRMYSLGMLLTALSTLAFLHLILNPRNQKVKLWWGVYLISTTLGLYVQYAFAIIPLAQLATALLFYPQNGNNGLVPVPF
jgi:uncharacterized membrane protein